MNIDFLIGRLHKLLPHYFTYSFKQAPAFWAALSAFVYERENELKRVRTQFRIFGTFLLLFTG